MRLACLLAIATLAAACHDDTPSCAALADHVAAVAAQAGPSTFSVADRASLIRNCEAEAGRNAAMRRCVMAARDLASIKECELRAAFGR